MRGEFFFFSGVVSLTAHAIQGLFRGEKFRRSMDEPVWWIAAIWYA